MPRCPASPEPSSSSVSTSVACATRRAAGYRACFTTSRSARGVGIRIDEALVPVRAEVRAASDLLGLDPLYIACEGRLVAALAPEHAERVLLALRDHPLGRGAAIIGHAVAEHPGTVRMRARIGGERVVPMLSGEQLPRIC